MSDIILVSFECTACGRANVVDADAEFFQTSVGNAEIFDISNGCAFECAYCKSLSRVAIVSDGAVQKINIVVLDDAAGLYLSRYLDNTNDLAMAKRFESFERASAKAADLRAWSKFGNARAARFEVATIGAECGL